MTLRYFASDKDTHFAGALTTDAIENESINMTSDWQATSKQKCVISELMLESDQNLDWEIVLWSTSAYSDTDLDVDKGVTRIKVPASTGEQIAGAGQYYYENPLAQSIDYIDEDNRSKVHIGLINRDVTAKNAGATGNVVIRIGASLTL